MKAFIFAAGIGSRLKPWTNEHPKALVVVHGKPMLCRVIENITQHTGINSYIVNTHHFAQQIVDYIATADIPVDIAISDETERLLDTGGALLKALDMIGHNDLLAHNADIYTDFDYTQLVQRHRECNNHITLLTKKRDTNRQLFFDRDDKLCGWINMATGELKPAGVQFDSQRHTTLAFSGIQIISPEALKLLPEYANHIHDNRFSLIDFYLWAMDKIQIACYNPPDNYTWIDIGKNETLQQAQNLTTT